MSLETDPDLALVRRLHLELNGSGRRTRGAVQPPAKKAKREPITASIGLKETSSLSQSGSDSQDVGKTARKENGTLKRLTKKQPDSDSNHNHNHLQEDDNTTVQNGRKEALEPQASTKIASDTKAGRAGEGDVGSRSKFDVAELGSMDVISGEDHARLMARSAAGREASSNAPRVKCFYLGSPYGVSLAASACNSKKSLMTELKRNLGSEPSVCSGEIVETLIYNGEGKQYLCTADESEEHWNSALKGAKRIYLSARSTALAS